MTRPSRRVSQAAVPISAGGPVVNAPTVVDEGIARHLGLVPASVRVVPREQPAWWRVGRRLQPPPLDPERVLDLLCEVASPALVLARPAAADPGAACLATIAGMLGHHVITLPDGLHEAVWSVGVMFGVPCCGDDAMARVTDVICCGPEGAGDVPLYVWGPTGIAVPALRPATLARWAYSAWHPCGWCDGGGVPGRRCRRCGAPVHHRAGEVAA